MVVHAFLTPILLKQAQVQIPALNLVLAIPYDLLGGWTKGDGREAGRTAQAFLGAAITDIDLPFIYFEGAAAERRHRINQKQRSCLMDERSNVFQRLPGSG